MQCFEIVRLLPGNTLVDAETYECLHRFRNGSTLKPGFYVVVWPESVNRREYEDGTGFVGPFATSREATAARPPSSQHVDTLRRP